MKPRTYHEMYQIAHAIGMDAGNRRMRMHGRTSWNDLDWEASVREFNRVFPERMQRRLQRKEWEAQNKTL